MTDTPDELVQELISCWTAATIGQDALDAPEHHHLLIATAADR